MYYCGTKIILIGGESYKVRLTLGCYLFQCKKGVILWKSSNDDVGKISNTAHRKISNTAHRHFQ